jgi:hypothetical protein
MPKKSQKTAPEAALTGMNVGSEPEPGRGTSPPARRGAGAKELLLEEGRTNLTLRRRVAYFLLSIFALNAVGTLTAVYLVGFGLMVLSNTVILTLIGETVAHAAAMFVTVTKFLFPTK